MRTLLLPTLLLTGCQPCEGPIVVYLEGMDDTAEVTWAPADGSAEPAACTAGIDEGSYDCGPDDDEAEGDYIVTAYWNGSYYDEAVTIENDSSCTKNGDVTISAAADTTAQ